MNTIEIMDTHLANMIAAGEVVERPASAVKELVENSIDAKASKIEIHLLDSGVRQIKIIDNGTGMNNHDAKIAFLRHATSKVRSSQDIMRIVTLGFRGEALPSIASVADVTLKTNNGSDEGTFIHIKAGEIQKEMGFLSSRGTEIEVNHLFYNTPARLKHIKSLNTELSHITDYLTKAALSRPDVSINFSNNGKEIFKTSGNNDLLNVIKNIYGYDIAQKMHYFSKENSDFSIDGYIAQPDITRASRNYITILVNNRPIKNFEVVRAVIEAYHTFLPIGRFPIAVIHIKLDPILVDVNVHPAKIEVRFSKEESLKSFITSEIQKTLKKLTYIPEPVLTSPSVTIKPKFTQPTISQASNYYEKQNFSGNNKKSTMFETADSVETISRLVDTEYSPQMNPLIIHETPVNNYQTKEINNITETEEIKNKVTVQIPDSKKNQLQLDYIGQLHGTYLLAQNAEGLFLIDQHAAMERVEYEKNYPLLGSATSDCVELLVPILLDYSIAEIVRINNHIEDLRGFGFVVEIFGNNEIIVRSVPLWAINEPTQIIKTIINVYLSGQNVTIAKLREAVSITMSCKKSIKANQYINNHEVGGLLAQLCRCNQPYTCPHGRPIIVKLTTYEIEKLFKRA